MRAHSSGWLPMWVTDQMMAPERCRQIVDLARSQRIVPAVRVLPDGREVVDTEFRRCDNINFYPGDQVYQLALESILDNMPTIRERFDFRLHRNHAQMLPHVFINRYVGDADAPAHLHWHHDTGSSTQLVERKVSISILLNDPKEWTGGELDFGTGDTTQPLSHPETRIGTGVMFPSFVYHRVRPVTSGVRYSLVAWLRGPRFK